MPPVVPPYVPLDGRPFRLAMGLRALDVDLWLEPDGERGPELARKLALLEADHAAVFAARPGSEAGGVEVYDLVDAWLARHHPDLSAVAAPNPALHPLDAAARLVQEDLCLMERTTGRWTLTAASVCFPSRWRLADKLGADLDGIHRPVPGYAERLSRPTAAFFDRLTVERPVWRLNWTLIDTPALHLPDPAARHPPPDPADGPGRALWFRVERQTLRRLPRTGGVLFTIRSYVTPLDRLVSEHPEAAAGLRIALATVPDDMARYKGWTGMIESCRAWLGTFAGH